MPFDENGMPVSETQDQSTPSVAPAGSPAAVGPLASTQYSPAGGGSSATGSLPDVPGVDADASAHEYIRYLTQSLMDSKKKQSAPGSFADRLKSAVGEMDASFGDTAGAAQGLVPGESGAGHGVAMTMAARTKRLAGEREEARRDEEFRQRTAMNTIDMITHTQALMNENAKMQNAVFESNKASVKAREDAGWHVEHDVSEQEARQRIAQTMPDGKHYTDLYDFVPTGFDEIGGRKVPKYDVISKQDKMVDVTDDEAAYIKENGGPDLTGAKQVPYVSLRAAKLDADKVSTGRIAVTDSYGKELDAKQKLAMNKALQTPDVQAALRIVPGDRIGSLMKALDMLDGGVTTAQMTGAKELGLEDTHGGIKQHKILLQHAQALLAQAQKSGNQQTVQAAQEAVQEAQEWVQKHEKAAESIKTVLTSLNMDKEAAKEHADFYKEDEKTRHDRAEEAIQNRRADIAAEKGRQDKQLESEYKIQNAELDKDRKPLSTQLESISNLRSELDEGTAASDAIVGPTLLKALIGGGGMRITHAEISNFTHGRSTLEDLKGYVQKLTNGKSITPEQRKQVYLLLGAVEAKADAMNHLLLDAQDQLNAATTVADTRDAVNNFRKKAQAMREGKDPDEAVKPSASAAPAPPKGAKTFNNGAIYTLDGKNFIVTKTGKPYVPPAKQ